MKLTYILLLCSALIVSACQSSGVQKQNEDDIKKRASLHYRLGIDALHKGFIPKAFEELMLADSIEPKNAATLDAIAYSWRLRGNLNEAKKHYQRAIRYNPAPATRNNYGSLLVEMGEYKEAVKQLKLALDDPRYNKQDLAFTNLGDAYVGLHDYENAIAAYRKAQFIAPRWAYPKLREASAYVTMKRPNYAQALYETILRSEPTNQQALQGLMALLQKKGDKNAIKVHLQTFIQHTTNPLQKAWAKDELAQLQK
ncbi:tetratricopeptide repeat protein [Ghiorsea bivora]|uniref:tetratricopeptide repeat protein n=1 Tax=Ghiorsea bivora TaxID=1485545 RepID=UPI00056F1D15|nr:tetratricopeptide repeat protein [Ghiorsea bivora]